MSSGSALSGSRAPSPTSGSGAAPKNGPFKDHTKPSLSQGYGLGPSQGPCVRPDPRFVQQAAGQGPSQGPGFRADPRPGAHRAPVRQGPSQGQEGGPTHEQGPSQGHGMGIVHLMPPQSPPPPPREQTAAGGPEAMSLDTSSPLILAGNIPGINPDFLALIQDPKFAASVNSMCHTYKFAMAQTTTAASNMECSPFQVAEPEPMDGVQSSTLRRPRSPSDNEEERASEDAPSTRAPTYAESAKRVRICDRPSDSRPATDPATATAAPAAAAATGSSAATKTKTPRYPPLVVKVFKNSSFHTRELKRLLGRAPRSTPQGKGVRFNPRDDNEFRVVQRYLTELEKTEKLDWFCFSLPAERSLKVAIRGLPSDAAIEDISEELRSLGFEPEYVRPIQARQGRSGCIFYALIKKTGEYRRIYDVRELLAFTSVRIELWRGKKGPAQCHRCQEFRHSSHNCHQKQACVRCGGEHAARDCPRPLEEPATCANCEGAHPASNPKCPVFREEARNKKAGAIARTSTRRPLPEGSAPTSLTAPANNPAEKKRRRRKRAPRKKKTPTTATAPAPAPSKTPAPAAAVSPSTSKATKEAAPSAPAAEKAKPKTSPKKKTPDSAKSATSTSPEANTSTSAEITRLMKEIATLMTCVTQLLAKQNG